MRGWLARAEGGAAIAILGTMAVLPVVATLARWLTGQSWGGVGPMVQSLNLWLAFTGAALAATAGRHLSLSTGSLLRLEGAAERRVQGISGAVAAAVSAVLAWAGVQLVLAERGSDVVIAGGIPNWAIESVIPLGFAVMALRFAWRSPWRGVAFAAIAGALVLGLVPPGSRAPVVWAGSAIVMLAVALGAPLFTAMGGIALLLFFGDAVPLSAVPAETYRIVSDPSLPTIPLFTVAGYLLAEGGASRRLVALFRAWVGWLPGGTAATTILVCAFFTTFTGASGVTILALGGLLLPVLLKSGYTERFSIGLIAAAGSIGLLFPPSLPVILYGVVSHVPIDKLYMAGVVPGVLLVGLLVTFGVVQGRGARREPFQPGVAMRALWDARWEALLPVLVVGGIFGGLVTVTEAAAFTAVYAFVIEVVLHDDLRGELPRVVIEAATLVGGVLIILGVALGFTSYLVDAEIPMKVAAWAQANIGNRLVFILLLNVFLLGVGCLMDVYSAIMVVVPLIVPIGAAFGIDPLHLGILFLANLELGYLTPPVGLNLFLASYRFDQPLTAVYRMALPFLGILALGVVLIAYVPGMTTWVNPPAKVTQPDSALPQGADLQRLLQEEDAPALPTGAELQRMLEEDDTETQ